MGNLLIAITKFILRSGFSSSLVTVKFLGSSSRLVTKENISIGETVSFRLDWISGTKETHFLLGNFYLFVPPP